MAQETLTRVMEHIGTLDLSELTLVQRAIQERLETAGYSPAEWKAMQALVKAGLQKQIKPRLPASDTERPLVSIQGKPLSETIIEERR